MARRITRPAGAHPPRAGRDRLGTLRKVTSLLGGDASPIGWTVQYVAAPAPQVLDTLVTWRRGRGQDRVEVSRPLPTGEALHTLTPFETPWTRELLLPNGAWTAYLNNGHDGGDPTASASVLARRLGVRCVVAMNSPRHGGHQSTQLWVLGPDGTPPLGYERTLTATCEDGRWTWLESGTPFSFEDTARYTARRKRDRLDRPLLLAYLTALGIPVTDEALGPGVVVQQVLKRPRWTLGPGRSARRPRRTTTLEQARAELS